MTGYVALTIPGGLGESMFLVVRIYADTAGNPAVITVARNDTRAKAEALAALYNERYPDA